jgi:hypothetical protein
MQPYESLSQIYTSTKMLSIRRMHKDAKEAIIISPERITHHYVFAELRDVGQSRLDVLALAEVFLIVLFEF